MRNKFVLNFIKDERWRYLTDGLVITIEVALSAVFFGACIGFFIAIVRTTHEKRHNLGLLNGICKIYLTVIRGTPMVVQLLIAYFVIFSQIREKIIVAIIAFSLNSGAYVAEVIRSGISSIDNGQMEAGRSLGLSYLQTLRYIVLPQAVRNVLPALGNEFITLLKDTSIAGYIALPDLTKGGDIIRSQTYDAFMPFLAVAAIYLSIVILFTWLLGKLEAKLNRNGAV
ncbi:MAG: amino acid ABC transporter permease [Kiritimatiellia bacterium]